MAESYGWTAEAGRVWRSAVQKNRRALEREQRSARKAAGGSSSGGWLPTIAELTGWLSVADMAQSAKRAWRPVYTPWCSR